MGTDAFTLTAADTRLGIRVPSWLLVSCCWFRFKRFEVGGLNILPFSLKPLASIRVGVYL